MAICPQCGKPFKSKRATARFCGTLCRVTAFNARQIGVLSVKVPVPITIPSLSVKTPLAASSEAPALHPEAIVGQPIHSINLMDEAPAIGCGFRRVQIVVIDEK